MRSIRGRLKALECLSALQPKCICPYPLMHYEQPDGTVMPPYMPCIHPSGACPLVHCSDDKPVHAIIIGRVKRADYGDNRDEEFLQQLDAQADWELGDWLFVVANKVRVIVWRDEGGKLCYYGPPRFWERLVPHDIVRGPRVPADYEAMVEELKRDETWSAGLSVASPERRRP